MNSDDYGSDTGGEETSEEDLEDEVVSSIQDRITPSRTHHMNTSFYGRRGEKNSSVQPAAASPAKRKCLRSPHPDRTSNEMSFDSPPTRTPTGCSHCDKTYRNNPSSSRGAVTPIVTPQHGRGNSRPLSSCSAISPVTPKTITPTQHLSRGSHSNLTTVEHLQLGRTKRSTPIQLLLQGILCVHLLQRLLDRRIRIDLLHLLDISMKMKALKVLLAFHHQKWTGWQKPHQ